jgi:hypothetical protein
MALNIPGYTAQPFDYAGMLADARRESRRQGLLGVGIGLLSQGPSPYPIGFMQSVGRGLAGYQAGQQSGYDQALERGMQGMKLGLLNNEQALKLYDVQRKYDLGEEMIAGLTGQPSGAGVLTGADGSTTTPGLLNQPAATPAPTNGAIYGTGGAAPPYGALRASESDGRNIGTQVRKDDGTPGSDAFGPYQFTSTRWNDLITRHPELGLTAADRFDPAAQEKMMPIHRADDAAVLQPMLGRQPTEYDLNVAHMVGAGGAAALLTARATDSADDVLNGVDPAILESNPQWRGKTVQALVHDLALAPEGASTMPAAAPGTQLAQAAPTGATATDIPDQTLGEWFRSQPLTYQQLIKGQLKGGADPDEVFKVLHEDFMKGHYGAPVIDPIMGPGQFNQQSGEFKTKGGTNITLPIFPGLKGDVTYEEERSKSLTKSLDDVAKGADQAYQNAQVIEGISTAAQALGAQGGQTGPLEPFKADIGAVLKNAGIDILPDDPGYAKTIQALTQQLALGKIGEGGMPANNFSNADLKLLLNTVANLGDTPTAFMMKLEIQRRMNARAIEAQQMWDDGLASGRYADSKEGARQFLADLRTEVRGKPLFSDTERKAIIDAAKAAGAPGSVDYYKKFGLTPKEQ